MKVDFNAEKDFWSNIGNGYDAFKVYVPCKTKKEAEQWVIGNGDVVRIKEYKLMNPISMDKIIAALKTSAFEDMEIDLISRALRDCEFIE